MHRFNRGDSPVDFEKIPRKHKENWNVFGDKEPDKKARLRDALYERQHHYCAYCEKIIGSDEKNRPKDCLIEHLEPRAETPKKTFDWNNMFLSCYSLNNCGKYKDKAGKFNVDDIIDPSKENPLDYYSFDRSGEIRAIKDATPEIKRKVEETVRLFNLNDLSKLIPLRNRALNEINSFMEPYNELGIEPSDEDIENFLKDLPDSTSCISVYYAYFNRSSAYEERFSHL